MSLFSKRMKKLRIEKEITLDTMAREIGVDKSTLSRYENDKTQPKSEILNEIAEYLGCSSDYLLGKIDNPQGHIVEPAKAEPKDLRDKLLNVLSAIEDEGYIEVIDNAREKGISPEALQSIIDVLDKLPKKK